MANPPHAPAIHLKPRIKGISLLAKQLGVSREWIWTVQQGRGTSQRVKAALKAHGIPVLTHPRCH